MRILLVEDNAATRLALAKLLRQKGAEVMAARDGSEGLELLVSHRFDVLITDLRMPVMDGFELLERCMALPAERRPARVVAISGEYETRALQGLPVKFMAKPVELDALLAMLEGKPN